MLRSLYTGALGIKSHQNKMDVIGNNISNVNTVGFKSGRATFSDMLSQNIKGATASNGTIGSTNPKQIGLGSNIGSIDTIFKNGAPLTTGKNTDLCLSGDGMFVVKSGSDTYYTRYGAFDFDAEGNYVLPSSGHYVQGWTANDGIINTNAATGNIKVAKGQTMSAKATDIVNYFDNLSANVPAITGISGGVDVVSKIIRVEDVSETDPLPVTIGTRSGFYFTGISDNLDTTKTWRAKDNIPLGATTADIVDEDGNVITCKLSPAATYEVLKDSIIGAKTYILTKSSVNTEYPLTLTVDGKRYTAIGMDKNLDKSKTWNIKAGGATAGSNKLTITNGSEDVTFTLDSALTETLGRKITTIETRATVASEANPVTITLSDGTSVVKTDGSYKIGNSLPIATTVKVYDSLGATHEIPVYYIHEGELGDDGSVSYSGKWLVSLTPDASVIKGQTTTSKFTDANGNEVTASFDVAEIQFDSSGNMLKTSDTTGNLNITYNGTGANKPDAQNVTIDFTELTQYAGSNTVRSAGNGNVAGTLNEIQIDSSGIITGIYTNGIRRPEAQVAVAHFANLPGLLKTGQNLYKESDNSGVPVINDAEKFGVTITAGALEMSNVDISNEFADMIITQRGFQSNSKIITVGDEMIETAINMKR